MLFQPKKLYSISRNVLVFSEKPAWIEILTHPEDHGNSPFLEGFGTACWHDMYKSLGSALSWSSAMYTSVSVQPENEPFMVTEVDSIYQLVLIVGSCVGWIAAPLWLENYTKQLT